MQSDNIDVEAVVLRLCECFRAELKDLLGIFGSSKHKFVNFEVALQDKLREVGRRTLEEAVPYLYGTGYTGSTFMSREGDVYNCNERSKKRSLKTIFGKISFERARYYNEDMGATKSPTDIQMDIENTKLCPLLRYWSCLLGTVTPFDEASNLLNKIARVVVSDKDIRVITEDIAQQTTHEHNKGIVGVKFDENNIIEPAQIHTKKGAAKKVYFETDGCHIPTTDGWHECKTLLLFEMEKKDEENILFNKHYFSSTRDVSYFKKQVKIQLEKYCKNREIELVCIADGADWIWNMMTELVPQGTTQILDWYHISEKMWGLANVIFADDKNKPRRFVDEQLDWLTKGNVDVVLQNLVALKYDERNKSNLELIDKLMGYVEKNKERMKYDFYRSQGYCIGSGAIESANKHVIQRRLKLPGIRWEPNNADIMAHLRAEYINRKLEGFFGLKTGPSLEIVET